MPKPEPDRCARTVWRGNQSMRCPYKAKPGKRLCGIHQRQADARNPIKKPTAREDGRR